MLEELKEKILENKIISFDMFDTLVLRIVDTPEIVFDLIGKKYKIKDFRKIRHDMQAEYGLQLQQEKGFPHANIDEIYDYMKKQTKISNTKELQEYEVNLEKRLLFRNNQMYEIYKFAKENNKRVIVTSDMYILYDDIKAILDNCGYGEVDKIYLSSKERKAKFDGTLYDYVIEEEGVSPDEILHIGDNLKDDYNIAKSKGLNAFQYKRKSVKTPDIVESVHNGIVNLIDKNYDDFWVRLGAKAGLLYLALYKELINRDYKEIYFLARDGYNLFNLFNKYNEDIKGHYVYTSRRALLLASISKLDDKALNILPPFTYGQTIREILEYVGMVEIFDENDLKEVGFNSFEDRISSVDDINNFKKIYRLKEVEVLEICNQERKNAKKYFQSLNMLEGENLVFDCGWNGSSQFLLENFVHSISSTIEFEFYYAGIFNTEKSRNQLANRKYSTFLFDIDRNQALVDRVRDCIVLLELFFGSPENSILKYDENGYVFDNFEENLDYKKKILEGLDIYFEHILPLDKEFNFEIDVNQAIKPLLRLIEKPTMEEAINIGDIENVDAFAKQKGIKKYIGKLTKENIKENKNVEVYWKYGIVKRNDIDEYVKKFVKKKYSLDASNRLLEKTKINVFGYRNPVLHIIFYRTDSIDLRIVEDGVNIPFTTNVDLANGVQTIDAVIKNKSDIEVYIADGSEEVLLKTIHNYSVKRLFEKIIMLFMRVFNKIMYYPKKIAKKVYWITRNVGKAMIRAIKYAWKEYHFLVPPKMWKKEFIKFHKIIVIGDENSFVDCNNDRKYRKWLKFYDVKSKVEKLDYNPLISFVIPVYNVSRELLSECLDSILGQTYQNFEICLADDCSKKEETIATLKEYEQKDKRIKVVYRKENGHISRASNSALELVTGEYVAMMDNDDVIPSNALYELVKALNNDKTIDMIYTDEDKYDTEGRRCCPHFKSDFAPDTLMSVNYFCHFTLLRTSILKEIGGWKVGYEGAQDWDLFLRFTEVAKNVYHLPKILYHWRMIPGSTSMTLDNKNYAALATTRLLEDALKRRKVEGEVHLHDRVPYYWIEYKYKKEPMVSIVIPTKDYASTLKTCLESIYSKNSYKNFEVIVADNRSSKKETFELFETYKKEHDNFRVVKADMEFNFSKINNLAVKEAKGDYVLLLNNDIEVITENWLSLMVGYAMQSHIGAVGAKLIYPDKTIQHGGVVLGMGGGVAGHAFLNEPLDSLGVFGRLSVPYNYSVVTAACLMVDKKKYLEVNGLEEDLKVAYNDVDFCLKLQKAGYYNVLLPMVELYHFESKSRGQENTPEKLERFKKEEKYMYDHWGDWIHSDPMYNENLSRVCVFQLRTDDKDVVIKP